MSSENPQGKRETQCGRVSLDFCFSIPSSEPAIVFAVELVRKAMELIKLDEDWIFRVEIALQEALLNGHLHGNQGNSAHQLRVDCVLSPKTIELHVEDIGLGYDLSQNFFVIDCMEPGGRGLHLIRQLMDSVTISENGSHIAMALVKE
jgi:anti-sigma regulatory factor (Ser/Thr protein kinase)